MRFTIVCVCMLLHVLSSHGQFKEYFNYQDMSAAMRWHGTDTAWVIENGYLKSHFGQINSSFYISTVVSPPANNSWQWWMQLNFNTSSLNYVDIYVGADKPNLLDSLLYGYFVRVGNTKDEVCLYRKDAGKTPVLLIDGRDGITDHTTNTLNIKVTCSADHEWTLFVNDFIEGTSTDSSYFDVTNMGFLIKQSTASFIGKHLIDDVIVGDVMQDTTTIADVVINEILYDPVAGVPEFIELYNRSTTPISLSKLAIARKKSDGDFTTAIALPAHELSAHSYVALTTDPDKLCQYYQCTNREQIVKMTLPTLTNVSGDVIILNNKGDIIDELRYTDSMHIPLAHNTKGVSLERLDAYAATNSFFNWHSAASTMGYATPGAANSQQLRDVVLSGKLTLTPTVFSPDNDGMDDVVQISYALPAPGFIGNILIYNVAGRIIKTLCRNILLDPKGYFIWDGTDDRQNMAPTGLYVVNAILFDNQGNVQRWKLPLVLAKKKNS